MNQLSPSQTPEPPATPGDDDACEKFPFLSPGRSQATDALPMDTGFTYQNVQSAVDEIYELRSKLVRIAMMSILLYRPDPEKRTTQTEREENLLIMRTDVRHFRAVVTLMENGTPFNGIPPDIATWISTLALEKPAELATTQRVCTASEDLLHAAETQQDQSGALQKHRFSARAGFHEAVIALCEHIWSNHEKERTEDLARAKSAAKSLDTRLTRLERIGTHVRLVSLNASVEASRIGEEGRGLSLIAQEFKMLAEEVQALVCEARSDVDSMRTTR